MFMQYCILVYLVWKLFGVCGVCSSDSMTTWSWYIVITNNFTYFK